MLKEWTIRAIYWAHSHDKPSGTLADKLIKRKGGKLRLGSRRALNSFSKRHPHEGRIVREIVESRAAISGLGKRT